MLFAFVLWTIFYEDANMDYLTTALAMAFFLSLVTVIDYHWSSVVRFYAKYPSVSEHKIRWLESDSEPSFAY